MNTPEDATLEGWAHTPFLKKVTSTAPSIIYIFNQLTQSNEYANRSLGESLGYSIKEIQDMGDALFVNLCYPDDLPLVGANLEAVRQMADDEIRQIEYRMKHKDGRWVWLLSYDTVFERDESGRVIRHLGIATDITEQKNAEEKALAERRAADSANRELRALAYSMSHDMKAPANTLHLLLKELDEEHRHTLNSDACELLDMSLKTVERMQSLVSDILDYTEVVGRHVEFENIDLNVLVNDVVQSLMPTINRSGARLHVEKLPTVKGSRMHLAILFEQLLSNALSYQPKKAIPEISISGSLQEHRQLAVVHVKDNGIGIHPRHHQKIFDMFKRLHVNEDYSGTGLGLTICRRIALIHKGNITVTSEMNEGATFSVSLEQ